MWANSWDYDFGWDQEDSLWIWKKYLQTKINTDPIYLFYMFDLKLLSTKHHRIIVLKSSATKQLKLLKSNVPQEINYMTAVVVIHSMELY